MRVDVVKDETGNEAGGALTKRCALTRIGLACGESLTTGAGELLPSVDSDLGAINGCDRDCGCGCGCRILVGGADKVGLEPESVALLCAPPVLCAVPVRGSSVADEPNDAVPATLVEPSVEVGVVAVDVDDELGGGADAVGSVGDTPGGVGVDDESVDVESDGSANAMPGTLAAAAPTPNATAKAPTRPIYLALPIAVPFPGHRPISAQKSGDDDRPRNTVMRMGLQQNDERHCDET